MALRAYVCVSTDVGFGNLWAWQGLYQFPHGDSVEFLVHFWVRDCNTAHRKNQDLVQNHNQLRALRTVCI